MDFLAILILLIFFAGYVLLAGLDIGVCMLLPFLGRTDRERGMVVTAVSPFFLTSGVWLVAVVGLLAGLFPGLKSMLLHGLYPLVVLLLIGWVLRDTGLWFRGLVAAAWWRGLCDGAVVSGAWLLAVGLGGVFGSAIGGLPGLNAGALLAVPIALLYVAHGAGYAARKLTGAPQHRAARVPGTPAVTSAALAAGVLLAVLRMPLSGTLADASAVSLVVVPVLILLPFLVCAQALVWWTFRGRVGAAGGRAS